MLDKTNSDDIRFIESLNQIKWPVVYGHIDILIQAGRVARVEISKTLKSPPQNIKK